MFPYLAKSLSVENVGLFISFQCKKLHSFNSLLLNYNISDQYEKM
jgi:hypothetical protein